MVVRIWFFVAFLASDSSMGVGKDKNKDGGRYIPARVTSRLSAHGTLAFGRSGSLR